MLSVTVYRSLPGRLTLPIRGSLVLSGLQSALGSANKIAKFTPATFEKVKKIHKMSFGNKWLFTKLKICKNIAGVEASLQAMWRGPYDNFNAASGNEPGKGIAMEFVKKNTWVVLVVAFGILIAVGIGLS